MIVDVEKVYDVHLSTVHPYVRDGDCEGNSPVLGDTKPTPVVPTSTRTGPSRQRRV